MRIGVFSDAHDHVDNVRRAVAVFNDEQCDLVICTGDFVSPIVIPPLRRLHCKVIASFGDNEGNKQGLHAGMSIIGQLGEPPFGVQLKDGTKILVTHIPGMLDGMRDGADIILYGHTHRACIAKSNSGQLVVNPGEVGGWFYRKPSVAIIETETREARLVLLHQPAETEEQTR